MDKKKKKADSREQKNKKEIETENVEFGEKTMGATCIKDIKDRQTKDRPQASMRTIEMYKWLQWYNAHR